MVRLLRRMRTKILPFDFSKKSTTNQLTGLTFKNNDRYDLENYVHAAATTCFPSTAKRPRNCNLPSRIDPYVEMSRVLYLATRQQVIPTAFHGPFKLLTRPITHFPARPLTVVSFLHVYRGCNALHTQRYAPPLSELSGCYFVESSRHP